MGKEDTVAAQLAAIQTAQTQAISDGLAAAYDQGALDQKASDGTLTQADVDKAVADAQAADAATLATSQATDAQALADAGAKATADLAALQAQLDSANAGKAADDVVVKGLNDAMASIQGSLDALKALFPAPPAQ